MHIKKYIKYLKLTALIYNINKELTKERKLITLKRKNKTKTFDSVEHKLKYYLSPSNGKFLDCYYINLQRSINRRIKMTEMYNDVLIKVNAIDGNNLKDYKKRTKYELACTLSHIKAIKKAYNNNLDGILIFEDDIYIDFINQWDYTINQIISMAPKDMNCIQFHCSNIKILKKITEKNTLFTIWNKAHTSTGCYYINRKGMEKILNLKENLIMDKADTVIYIYIKTYTYNKPLFIHQVENSTIHSEDLIKHLKSHNYIKKYFNNIIN